MSNRLRRVLGSYVITDFGVQQHRGLDFLDFDLLDIDSGAKQELHGIPLPLVEV